MSSFHHQHQHQHNNNNNNNNNHSNMSSNNNILPIQVALAAIQAWKEEQAQREQHEANNNSQNTFHIHGNNSNNNTVSFSGLTEQNFLQYQQQLQQHTVSPNGSVATGSMPAPAPRSPSTVSCLSSTESSSFSSNNSTFTTATTTTAPVVPTTTTIPALTTNDLPEIRNRVRGYVDTIIRFQMPAHQGQAYMEAMAADPQVVRAESDPMTFVRSCKYNLKDASQRLALYWTERKALFGPDRAFLPLTLTGHGALNPSDVSLLQAGYPAVLPDTEQGQKVVMFDRRHFIPCATSENKQRVLFYIFNILAQEESALLLDDQPGVLAIVPMSTPKLEDVDFTYIHRALYLASNVFPVKLDIHLFNIPNQNRHYLIHDMMNAANKMIRECFTSPKQGLHLHAEKHVSELNKIMERLGMKTEGIPLAYGGNWKLDDFFQWCKDQEIRERQMYALPPSSATVMTVSSAGETVDTEEDKASKKRMAELLHSRRKRERKRQEVGLLKEESDRLKAEHDKLRAESRRLEQFLSQAQRLVDRNEPSSQ